MSYMSTKFCEICDEDYDWAAPECPGCVSRRAWEAESKRVSALRKAARDALYELSTLPSYLNDPTFPWPNAGLRILAQSHQRVHAQLTEALALFDEAG
jgi:hypothetical protein